MNGMEIAPVVLIVFNRPDLTEKVLNQIAKVRPRLLLVIADGPRPNFPDDNEKCMATRMVIEKVDWECEVIKNYSDYNMGCGLRPMTGLNWVFEKVDQAIILEDDCLPATSFFSFCSELLEKYKNDDRVMMISGTNVAQKWKCASQSYHFSYFGGSLGWASWRRAWRYYDYEMRLWSQEEVRNRIRDVLADEKQYRYRYRDFDRSFKTKNPAWWDYQWCFARYCQSGLTAVSSVNLISNLGFRYDATHSKNTKDPFSNLPLFEMQFPLIHPPAVAVDRSYDKDFFEKMTFESKLPPMEVLRKFVRRSLPLPLKRAIRFAFNYGH